MQNKSGLPQALKIVAVIFIATGLWSLADWAIALTEGQIQFNLGILGLLVGPGLLALSRYARLTAIALLLLQMVGLAWLVVLLVAAEEAAQYRFLGVELTASSPWSGIVLAVGLLALTVWQYSVLRRTTVAQLFHSINRPRR